MSDAIIIYPHQLFKNSPTVSVAQEQSLPIYLVEEPLLLTHNPIHRQKLMLHKLSLDSYERFLLDKGVIVHRLTVKEHTTSAAVFARLKKDGVKHVHIIDTTDNYLERAIENSGLERVWYESPLFLLEKEDAMERYRNSKRFMASFYKQLRKDRNILLTDDGEPVGGKWSFDDENRQSLPKEFTAPEDIALFGNADTKEAEVWAEQVDAEQYGEAGCWLPYTHAGAEEFLMEFLRTRFHDFGPYEDAMTPEHNRLWHSTLSPLMNIGLLTPQYVLDKALAYANKHDVPMNSLEGFVRQLIGWREFMRASYECDGQTMRNQNFFNHRRELKDAHWNGSTDLLPVDDVIKRALKYGYSHHIERLMIMGNYFLLTNTKPDDVYRWFMAMYVDAYDWVMVPNVYGMSQFADGGSFATKPYISGANYIKKMGQFPGGDWEATWTALYWSFIDRHKEFFSSNHRLSMMPKTLERMKPETRDKHFQNATRYLTQLSS